MIRHYTASQVDFSGLWQDENGSFMDLSVQGDKLKGTYRAIFKKNGHYEDFPLVGFRHGALITFAVSFGRHNSLSSFTGQHHTEHGVETIETVWMLTEKKTRAKGDGSPVGEVLTGSTEFRRIMN